VKKMRRITIAAVICISLFLLPKEAPAQTGGIGPGKDIIVLPIVVLAVLTVGIVVLVYHARHTMKGCLVSGHDGLELQADDKIYALTGDTGALKAGDLVKLHGSHVKATKGSNEPGFSVGNLSKDYGACRVPAAAHSQ
jgi:hypothetical protein